MSTPDLRLCRSVLFLPASNARAIEKARQLDADMVILDLEDAVKAEDKNMARQQAVAAFEQGFEGRVTALRLNGTGAAWHAEDLVTAKVCQCDYLVLPKVEDPAEVDAVAQAAGKKVLAMIETPRAILDAAAIAPSTAGLIAGTNDLAAELGLPPSAGRVGLAHSLQMIVLAARAAGVAAFDGVYNRLQDDAGLAEQCGEGRAFGFDGKTLIHPAQIATANRIFSPSEEEIEEARRLTAAASGGAERFEGRMIEAMHVDQARSVLAKARV